MQVSIFRKKTIAIFCVQFSIFRHGSDITLDVTAKLLDKSGMGLVTSPDGDSHIILNSKSLYSSKTTQANIPLLMGLLQSSLSPSSH